MIFNLGIADDEPAVRNGLVNHVGWARMGFRVVQSFEDGEDLLRFLQARPLHVVLTDIRMSVVSGLEVAKTIFERNIPTEVVLLTGYKDFEYAREAMRYSVRHYLLKPAHEEELREVFSEVHRYLEEKRAGAPSSLSTERDSDRIPTDKDSHSQPRTNAQAMRLVELYIRRNCHKPLAMTQVAREFYFSPSYFSRLFKEKTGRTFIGFLTDCRMARAETLIRGSPELSVSEIASRVGYTDSNYFSKLYVRTFGCTPTAYRKMLRHDYGK
jgi:two-component system, response regulator YesN